MGVAAVCMITLLTGCTAPAAPTSPLLDVADVPQVWADDIAAFPRELPEKVEWPTSPPAILLEDNTVYEPGSVSMLAAHYWLCAWEDEYLGAVESGDSDIKEVALKQVQGYADLETVKTYLLNPNEWREGVVAPAFDGDSGPIEEDFGATCEFYTEEQTKEMEIN
jgi:hypothetical protein